MKKMGEGEMYYLVVTLEQFECSSSGRGSDEGLTASTTKFIDRVEDDQVIGLTSFEPLGRTNHLHQVRFSLHSVNRSRLTVRQAQEVATRHEMEE